MLHHIMHMSISTLLKLLLGWNPVMHGYVPQILQFPGIPTGISASWSLQVPKYVSVPWSEWQQVDLPEVSDVSRHISSLCTFPFRI